MIESTSEDPLSIHLLVIRCQTGDESAFARLYQIFGEKTLRYLTGILGDDAPDVQQELWLSVYRRIRHVGNPNAFRTWLFRSTRHRAIDFLRSAKRERELLDDISIDDVNLSDEDGRGDSDLMDDEEFKLVLEAMPHLQREVLLLRYRDDMSYAEIALVVGCPVGTVRTRLHYAKQRMHELIKGDQ